ncbi:lipoprotein BA_5634 family protein [Bacillus cereus]|uniref:lipoprotein BA_5634 family protein n=1 Tax=Bacillus cereus TaxID=1396 RepID=UPI003D65E771
MKSYDLYKVKRAESDGKQVLIMDKNTAEGVMKKGVLRKTDHGGGLLVRVQLPLYQPFQKGKL